MVWGFDGYSKLTENGQDLYIRMPASELAKGGNSGVKKRVKIIVPIISALLVILLSVCLFYQLKRRKALQEGTLEEDDGYDGGNKDSTDDLELPLIDISILRKATENFSDYNKLGERGFGPVYKGVVENGQEVAVKRLSKSSTQGLNEFGVNTPSKDSSDSSGMNRGVAGSGGEELSITSTNWSIFPPQLQEFGVNTPSKVQLGDNQLHFANNARFWNAPVGDIRTSFFPSLQIPSPTFEDKPKITSKVVKESSSESSSTKIPRNENQSPLPAFKVKNEKLGDRIKRKK